MRVGVRDESAADQPIFGSIMVWHCILKIFCSTYICIYNKIYLIYFDSIEYCEYL